MMGAVFTTALLRFGIESNGAPFFLGASMLAGMAGGALWALIAGFLWPVTSVYAIGYMRAHHEENQTRFYAFFALALASTMGVAFAGNMLELRNSSGDRVVAMSQQAFDSLNDEQRRVLQDNGGILNAPIDTIEASAGGSVRCMIAEVHLPRGA